MAAYLHNHNRGPVNQSFTSQYLDIFFRRDCEPDSLIAKICFIAFPLIILVTSVLDLFSFCFRDNLPAGGYDRRRPAPNNFPPAPRRPIEEAFPLMRRNSSDESILYSSPNAHDNYYHASQNPPPLQMAHIASAENAAFLRTSPRPSQVQPAAAFKHRTEVPPSLQSQPARAGVAPIIVRSTQSAPLDCTLNAPLAPPNNPAVVRRQEARPAAASMNRFGAPPSVQGTLTPAQPMVARSARNNPFDRAPDTFIKAQQRNPAIVRSQDVQPAAAPLHGFGAPPPLQAGQPMPDVNPSFIPDGPSGRGGLMATTPPARPRTINNAQAAQRRSQSMQNFGAPPPLQ